MAALIITSKDTIQNAVDIGGTGYTPLQQLVLLGLFSIKEIRDAIPPKLFVRDTKRSLLYLTRDLIMAALLGYGATYIDTLFLRQQLHPFLSIGGVDVLRWGSWAAYWWFQSLVFTGLWIIAHECGHQSFSPSQNLCNIVGYIFHTALWTPYFSWKYSHHLHHSHNASLEKDVIYVPQTRSEMGLPPKTQSPIDYEEHLADTPLYSLLLLIRRQIFGFPAHFLFNVGGQNKYPPGTNHINRRQIMISIHPRNAVILSDIGIVIMICLVMYTSSVFGTLNVIKYYGVPALAVTHWIAMLTFLHHTDPKVPHFRERTWNYQRGAAATVDRAFLGWQGRFFLHDISHFHVAHHFFPRMPFYHAEEATKYLKEVLGEFYIRDDTPAFKALWNIYNSCIFVEDEDDIVFFKNKEGKAIHQPADKYVTNERAG
ncbi:fatty acid desaturase-domain-containing protein [Hysterangium stoloniferum]|nr:fatty acid desaturase-domain-containing protein [Hysterangium stoloniferum]